MSLKDKNIFPATLVGQARYTALGLQVWLGGCVALWTLQPLLFSRARGVIMLTLVTGLLALLGWVIRFHPLVIWSAGVGLCNLTLALLLASHPADLWTGLAAGIILLGLVDGHYRLTYLRRCRIEPGILAALLGMFIRLSGLTIVVGMALGLLAIYPAADAAGSMASGLVTIIGAGLLVTLLAVFLLYTNRWPQA